MNLLYRLTPCSVLSGQEISSLFWNLIVRNILLEPKIFISDKIKKKKANLELL